MKDEMYNRLKDLEADTTILRGELSEIEKKISRNLTEIARIRLHPFTEGQLVNCLVPMGRAKKECKCRVEIDEYGGIWVRPMRPDGTFRVTRFRATLESGKDYTSIFKEV